MKWRFSNERTEASFRDDPYDSLMEARSDCYMLHWESDREYGQFPCTPLLEDFVAECVANIKAKGDMMYSNWADMAAGNGSAVTAARMCSQCVQEMTIDSRPFIRQLLLHLCNQARGEL